MQIQVQDAITYWMLGFLALGVIGLCASLVQLYRSAVRARPVKPAKEALQFREMLDSTRSALVELQTLLSSDLVETTARHASSVAMLGRPEVELFQKIRKYQPTRPETA